MNSFKRLFGLPVLSQALAFSVFVTAGCQLCFDSAFVLASPSSSSSVGTQLSQKRISQSEAALQTAEQLANSERYDEANLMLGKLLREDPKNVRALCIRALCSSGTGNEELAIKDLNQAIAIDPKCAAAFRNRAKNWCVMGRNDLAKVDIAKAIELEPNNPQVYDDCGFIYANVNEFSKAVEAYTKAINLNPGHLILRRRRAMALTSAGRIAEAIVDYDYCIAHAKTNQEAYFLKANIYEKRSQFVKVADVYRALYQAKPTRLDNLQKLAVALVKANLFDEALLDCDKLIGASPEDEELYVLRARCYLGKQNPTRALKDLDRALALMGKGNKDVYQLRAQAHRSLGDTRLATQDEVELRHLQN